MCVKVGKLVNHKTYGHGCVISLDHGGKFTVRFNKKMCKQFFLDDYYQYFVTQKDPLLNKYHIHAELDSQCRELLAKFDGGDSGVGLELVNRLDSLSESRAVNEVCERLELLRFPMDFFLLTKRAKALRRIGKKSELAIAVATRALGLANTKTEASIALTVRAAAYADIEALPDAQRDGKEALIAKPDSYHACRVLGRVAVKRGDYADADRQFKEADALAPGYEGIRVDQYIGRVRELHQKGLYPEIEQVKAHIKQNWPTGMAERALTEIARILERA